MSFNYVYDICKLVIKYNELMIITESENNIQIKTDVEALKYGHPIGLDTLVVHTINNEY